MSDEIDIYARVSRLGDDRQRSVEGQVEDCTGCVLERGKRVGKVHIDNGRSVWNPRVKRPGWDRLMRRLESGEAGGVIIFDLARFSRRPIEGERLIAAAERGLLVLDSESTYDLTTASGKKAFRDQVATGAYESDRLSTRVRRGKRIKAMKGEPNAANRPFGFRADRITPDPKEAPILREAARRILDGDPVGAVVADLNARGVRGTLGATWKTTSLRRTLGNAQNAGLVMYKGVVVGRLPGDPILSEEDWGRLGALFASRRRGRVARDCYLASGVVRCGVCGRSVIGKLWYHRKWPDGDLIRVYQCRCCARTHVDQRALDGMLRDLVVDTLSDPRHAAAVEAAAAERVSRAQELDAQIAEADHTAEQLAGRLGRGEMPLARYDAAVAPLDRRLVELRAQRAALDAAAETPPDPARATAAREQWRARWDVAETADRRALVRQALRGRVLSILPAQRRGDITCGTDRIEIS